MQVTAVLNPAEEGGFNALNPETGTVSQGESIEEALANLREAVELYLEDQPEERSRVISQVTTGGLAVA